MADLRTDLAALADEWDGYGHGVYCTHLEDQLPCGTCTVLARIRGLLASSAPATASEGATEDCPMHGERETFTAPHVGYTKEPGCTCTMLPATGVTSSDGVERILAARAAQPEGTERVEWGVRHRDGWVGGPGNSREEVEQFVAEMPLAKEAVRRTVTTYAPVVGPWEVVGDE